MTDLTVNSNYSCKSDSLNYRNTQLSTAFPDSIMATTNTDSLNVDTCEFIARPGGTTNPAVLAKAPNPSVTVKGKTTNAVIVVNVLNNMLYQYDKDGKPVVAYKVATGSLSSLTPVRLYSYENIEYYPYDTAPKGSVRNRMPEAFGKAGLILKTVNRENGSKQTTGIMVHGSLSEVSAGRYLSGGCVRMFDDDILSIVEVMKTVPKGSYINVVAE